MPVDFYSSYSAYKEYRTPSLNNKDIARLDAEIWIPAEFSTDMRCLEVGSGTGAFLSYLATKGVQVFHGIDHDPALQAVQPTESSEHFSCADVWDFCHKTAEESYERIILLDVLEHFEPENAFRLLEELKRLLSKGGKIVLKVPNAGSPWGLSYQYGDLTHKTAFNAESLRQLATACDLRIERLYDQRNGSKRRRVTDALVNGFLSWALLTPPPFWGANLYALLSKK